MLTSLDGVQLGKRLLIWHRLLRSQDLSKEALPDELKSTDLHQYVFVFGKNIYVMNHTFPSSNFSLLFTVWRR